MTLYDIMIYNKHRPTFIIVTFIGSKSHSLKRG